MMVQPLWEALWRFLKKLNIELLCDPANSTAELEPKDLKAGTQIDICILMFVAALFTIAKRKKQPKRPSTNEWINQMWYIHTMEDYSVLKRNEILIYATTWRNLENIMLSEISHIQVLYDTTNRRYLE